MTAEIGIEYYKLGSTVGTAENGAPHLEIRSYKDLKQRQNAKATVGDSNVWVMQEGNHSAFSFIMPTGYELVVHGEFVSEQGQGFFEVKEPNIQFEIKGKSGRGETLILSTYDKNGKR